MNVNQKAYEKLSKQSHSMPKSETIYESEVALGRGYHFGGGEYEAKMSAVLPTELINIMLDDTDDRVSLVNMRSGKFIIDQGERITSNFKEEISNKFSLSANAPLGMITLGFLGEIETQVKRNQSSEYFVYIYAEIEGASSLDEVKLSKNMPNLLTPQAKVDMKNMERFVEMYGTHLVTGLYYGKILIIVGQKKSSSIFRRRKLKGDLNLKLDQAQIQAVTDAGGVVEVKLSDEYNKQSTEDNEFGDFKLFQAGGVNLTPEQINAIEFAGSPEAAMREARKALGANKKIQASTNDEQEKSELTVGTPRATVQTKSIFSQGHVVGARVDPYMKYMPRLQAVKISWDTQLNNNFDYLNLVEGKIKGSRYVYPGDEDQVVAVLAPRRRWFYTKARKDKRYEMGFNFNDGEVVPFVRQFKADRKKIAGSTNVIYDKDNNKASITWARAQYRGDLQNNQHLVFTTELHKESLGQLREFNSRDMLAGVGARQVAPAQDQVIYSENEAFIVHSVLGDGDCGYTAFGIQRSEAFRIIMQHLNEVRERLVDVVYETMLTNGDELLEFLKETGAINQEGSALEQAVASYKAADEARGELVSAEVSLKNAINNLNILSGYLDYDINRKQVDEGWSHPAVLQILAGIQGINLYIWREENGRLVPHQTDNGDYHRVNPNGAKERVDLMFINNNHFNRLQWLNGLAEKSEAIKKVKNTSAFPAFKRVKDPAPDMRMGEFESIRLPVESAQRRAKKAGRFVFNLAAQQKIPDDTDYSDGVQNKLN